MYRPSLTTILSAAFLCYMANSMWSIARLYIPPSCDQSDKTCISNLVEDTTELSLLVFTTTKSRPSMDKDLKFLDKIDISVNEEQETKLKVRIPKSVTRNGTMFLGVFSLPKLTNVDTNVDGWWRTELNHPHSSYIMTRLTEFAIPEAETFQLLGAENEGPKKAARDRSHPVTHLRSRLVLSVMTDQVRMSPRDVPGEIGHVMQLTGDRKQFLPILYVDELTMRLRDLVIVNATDKSAEVSLICNCLVF